MAYNKKKGNDGPTTKERLAQVQEEIRQNVLAGLKSGTPIWKMPWIGSSGRQKSYDTGKRYRGTNAFWLSLIAMKRGYTDNRWITFNRLRDSKYEFFPKGAGAGQGVKIYYYFNPPKKDSNGNVVKDENGNVVLEPYLTYREYTVFNVSLTNIPPEPKPVGSFTADEIGERMLSLSPCPIYYEGDQAFYRPPTDEIYLPPKETFLSTSGFYGTAFHEMIHATKHAKRCNRDMGSYAAEELVAESGSVMLATALGTEFEHKEEENATAYLLNWLERATLSDFDKALREAGKASEWLYRRYEDVYGETDGLVRLSVLKYGTNGPMCGLALLPVHDLVV